MAHRFRILRQLLSVILVASICAACTENFRSPIPSAAETSEQITAALHQGDFDSIVKLYSKDGALYVQEQGLVTGAKNLRSAWAAIKASGVGGIRLERTGLITSGKLAVETGTVVMLDESGVAVDSMPFTVVWKLEASHWTLYRDIALPAPTETDLY